VKKKKKNKKYRKERKKKKKKKNKLNKKNKTGGYFKGRGEGIYIILVEFLYLKKNKIGGGFNIINKNKNIYII
jgi:hypothetical protein